MDSTVTPGLISREKTASTAGNRGKSMAMRDAGMAKSKPQRNRTSFFLRFCRCLSCRASLVV